MNLLEYGSFCTRRGGYLIPLNMSSPILVSTLVSRALSSGIIGGGGPAVFGVGGVCTNCMLILLSLLSLSRRRRNHPLLRFDFFSSVVMLAVRLGGLEVVWTWPEAGSCSS